MSLHTFEGYMASIPIGKSNVTQCGLSGFMCPYDETVLLWNGTRVWKKFYEKRNEQDFIPAFIDQQAPRDGTVSENNSNAVQLGGGMLAESGVSLIEEDNTLIDLEETEN
jgi:hypothetical protein